MDDISFGEGLPAPDGDIDETRLELQHIGFAADALRRQKCCPRTAEGIEDDVAAPGTSFIASATSATGLTVGCASDRRDARPGTH